MRLILISAQFVFLVFFLSACKNRIKPTTSYDSKHEINKFLNDILIKHDIPGLAIAAIKDGELIIEKYKGISSMKSNESVDTNTLFRIYSVTKLITATAIFQLEQEGKIDLDDKISKYIKNLPESWNSIKIHQLLAHASGLPDYSHFDSSMKDTTILNKLYESEFEFTPGEKPSYNQTGYWLLTMIVEKVSNMSFEDYILKNQFEKDDNVLFSCDHTEQIKNRADFHHYNSEIKKYEIAVHNAGQRGNSSSGLNLTLPAFIKWNKRFDNNQFINDISKTKMWSPYEYTNKESGFLHGWGNYKNSVGFTGSGVCGYRKFIEEDLTIILLSNGFKSSPVHNEVIEKIKELVLNE